MATREQSDLNERDSALREVLCEDSGIERDGMGVVVMDEDGWWVLKVDGWLRTNGRKSPETICKMSEIQVRAMRRYLYSQPVPLGFH